MRMALSLQQMQVLIEEDDERPRPRPRPQVKCPNCGKMLVALTGKPPYTRRHRCISGLSMSVRLPGQVPGLAE